MNSSQIVVKQEEDVDGDDDVVVGGGHTITKFDIKSESEQFIAGYEKERSTETITTTKATVFEVKSEPLEQQIFDGKLPTVNNFGESFLIYEFEDAARMHSTTTTTAATTTTQPLLINSKLRNKRAPTKSTQIQSPVAAKKPAKENDVATVAATITAPITTTIPVAVAAETTTKSLPIPSKKPATIELKVKCLCRLGDPVAASATSVFDLKRFFDEMFDETRQLSRAQQREVKMVLLKAVSDAEEHLDAGRWCDKCCS